MDTILLEMNAVLTEWMTSIGLKMPEQFLFRVDSRLLFWGPHPICLLTEDATLDFARFDAERLELYMDAICEITLTVGWPEDQGPVLESIEVVRKLSVSSC